ncbi:MAG: hypothetical protein IT384_10150 [Deltaproteobacteria bacterium]|nr:hypothetical protein [Deltaproteobacteria bacterium]
MSRAAEARRRPRALVLLFTLGFAPACVSEITAANDGTRSQGGDAADTGVPADASSTDAGPRGDASGSDAGLLADASSSDADLRAEDAQVADAGAVLDAGAGPSDATIADREDPPDAAAADAASADARVDAGADAGSSSLSPCDPAAAGCPGGETCKIVLQGASISTRCVGTATNLPRDGICTVGVDPTPNHATDNARTDACTAGLACIQGIGSSLSRCVSFCSATTPCGAGFQCLGIVPASGSQPGVGACLPITSCDVVAQDCGAGLACYAIYDDAGNLGTSCFPAGSAGLGEACTITALSPCRAGMQCIGDLNTQMGVCRPLCWSEAVQAGQPRPPLPSGCSSCSGFAPVAQGTVLGTYVPGYCPP